MTSAPEVARGDRLSRLKDITTSTVVLATGLYAIGLLVTNMYLSRFHYEDFNLLRPRCILTGIWSCLLLFCCALPGLCLNSHLAAEMYKKRGLLETAAILAFCSFAGVILGDVVLVSLGVGHQATTYFRVASLSELHYLLAFCLLSWMLWLSGALLLKKIALAITGRWVPNLVQSQVFKLSLNFLIIIAAIFCLSDISATVYGKIDPNFGGGRPGLANLVLNGEGAQFWKQITNQSAPAEGTFITAYVYVYHETDSEFLLKVCECVRPQGGFVVMSKKLITDIITEFRDPMTITADNAGPLPKAEDPVSKAKK